MHHVGSELVTVQLLELLAQLVSPRPHNRIFGGRIAGRAMQNLGPNHIFSQFTRRAAKFRFAYKPQEAAQLLGPGKCMALQSPFERFLLLLLADCLGR